MCVVSHQNSRYFLLEARPPFLLLHSQMKLPYIVHQQDNSQVLNNQEKVQIIPEHKSKSSHWNDYLDRHRQAVSVIKKIPRKQDTTAVLKIQSTAEDSIIGSKREESLSPTAIYDLPTTAAMLLVEDLTPSSTFTIEAINSNTPSVSQTLEINPSSPINQPDTPNQTYPPQYTTSKQSQTSLPDETSSSPRQNINNGSPTVSEFSFSSPLAIVGVTIFAAMSILILGYAAVSMYKRRCIDSDKSVQQLEVDEKDDATEKEGSGDSGSESEGSNAILKTGKLPKKGNMKKKQKKKITKKKSSKFELDSVNTSTQLIDDAEKLKRSSRSSKKSKKQESSTEIKAELPLAECKVSDSDTTLNEDQAANKIIPDAVEGTDNESPVASDAAKQSDLEKQPGEQKADDRTSGLPYVVLDMPMEQPSHQIEGPFSSFAQQAEHYSAAIRFFGSNPLQFSDSKSPIPTPPQSPVKPEPVARRIRDCAIRHPSFDSTKPILVLDVDETLIHAHSKMIPKLKCDFMIMVKFGNESCEAFYVYKRPYVDFFLQAVKKMYNVVAFTAGIREYASQVLDRLDVHNDIFVARYYRDFCDEKKGIYVKDLTKITFDLDSILLIDNTATCFSLQPANGLHIKSFYYDMSDTQLPRVLEFLRELHQAKDVRTELTKWKYDDPTWGIDTFEFGF